MNPTTRSASAPAANSVPAVEMIDLTKIFGKYTAVDHLSLTVPQGQIFGLLGPNGSGKTTTINMLSGLSVPTSGQVKVLGYDVRHQTREVRQRLGAVPQETALYEELTAWTNMDFHAELFGLPAREKKQRITAMLELVQLLDRKDSAVNTFSGGMKRRLALARALLHDPKLVYLDEPTLGVDVQARRVIWDYILALRDQGKTVLITTNVLEEAEALCERIAIIDNGRLMAVDTPEHLKLTYGGRVVELETEHPLASTEALRAVPGVTSVMQDGPRLTINTSGGDHVVSHVVNLVSQSDELRNIAIHEPALEEIFLRLTGKALRD